MVTFTPFTDRDPLATASSAERLRLVDGILLTSDHFNAEQLYHRSRLARIASYLHGYGTVAGLDVRMNPATGGENAEIMVMPGLAVDYLGRLIELGHEACLRVVPWFDQQVETPQGLARIEAAVRAAGGQLPDHIIVDIFAGFVPVARHPEPAFATGNADQIDGVEPSRVADAAHLDVIIRQSGDDRLPESMIARLIDGAATIDSIRQAKRESLWKALMPRDPSTAPDPDLPATEHDVTQQQGTEIFLARLVLPFVRDTDGIPRFDSTFNLDTPATRPAQDSRCFSYSVAELALLDGHRS